MRPTRRQRRYEATRAAKGIVLGLALSMAFWALPIGAYLWATR